MNTERDNLEPETKAIPFVSVIMPVRNEEAFIERSLGATLCQNYPHDQMEILVVDGMSDDHTRERVKSLGDQSTVCVRIIDNPDKIVPPAMNLGIQAAAGEIIVRMDGHTIASPDYISACVRALEESGADNVGGRMDCVGDSILGKAIGAATSHPFGIGNAKFHYATEAQEVDTVYLGCWRKEAFQKFGAFDEYFLRTQDSEFNYRTRMLGGRVWLDPRIKSAYYNRASIHKLAKQYYQYGFWKTRLMFKLGGRLRLRHFAAPAFVGSLLASLVLMIASVFGLSGHPGAALILGALGIFIPALYTVADLAASTQICIQEGNPRYFPFLPLIFLVLHVSWGWGFLKGMIVQPGAGNFQPLRVLPHSTAHEHDLIDYPFVSVIVPVHNEEAYIRDCLRALLNQDYPAECYEILVMDGMSTDKTRDSVTEIIQTAQLPVSLLENPKIHTAGALNLGIQAAKGEIILRMDGHAIAAKNYIRLSVGTLISIDADNVGGVVEYSGTTWLARLIGLAVSSGFGCGGAPARSKRQGYVDTVSFGCWRKDAFDRFGLFDEFFSKTQDSELNYRIRLLGGKVWLNPAIRSTYFSRGSLTALARQYFKYGYWKSRLIYKLGWRLSFRHMMPPSLVMTLLASNMLLASLIFIPTGEVFWLSVRNLITLIALAPLFIYLVFCGIASLKLSLRKQTEKADQHPRQVDGLIKNVATVPTTMFLYALIHLTWGCGFIIGFFNPPLTTCFAPLPEPKKT